MYYGVFPRDALMEPLTQSATCGNQSCQNSWNSQGTWRKISKLFLLVRSNRVTEEPLIFVTKASVTCSAQTVERVPSTARRCTRTVSGCDITHEPTGALSTRTVTRCEHVGPIYWSPMTVAAYKSEVETERFVSTELIGDGMTTDKGLLVILEGDCSK